MSYIYDRSIIIIDPNLRPLHLDRNFCHKIISTKKFQKINTSLVLKKNIWQTHAHVKIPFVENEIITLAKRHKIWTDVKMNSIL